MVKKISKFSESLERKAVIGVPLTKTARPVIDYPNDDEKIKAKTKFKKIFEQLPEEARKGLVYHYWNNPRSLNVCYFEIREDTKLGRQILNDLGFYDD